MIDHFENLLEDSYDAPNGKLKIAILEEAIRIADSHLGIEERFDARMMLVDTAIFSEHGDKAIVAYAWCLAQYDKNPQLHNDYEMMWNYKWVVDRLLSFPDIQLIKVEEMLEDLRRRFQAFGYGSHFYYYMKQELAMNLDKRDEVEHYYEKWLLEPSDSMSDCRACTLTNQAKTLLYLDRFEEAYAIAEPIFTGRLSCHSVPHRTYAEFLLPLVKANRIAEAAEFFHKSYELTHNKTGYLEVIIKQLEYLAIVDVPKALSFLEKYLPEAVECDETSIKYYFYRTASILLNMQEVKKQTLQLPDAITAESINNDLNHLAERFNQSNNTDVYTSKIEKFHRDILHLNSLIHKNNNKG